ncbi:MAG: chemotaxis-specific protein-glutamate methyltransferase CheB [Cyanobacteria bacterium SZAS-4]|nr:chemotaxis-specific protein-glutamate methyltransferase CheB [Cyanobacteria bacterium SZAS-4]
MIKVLIVEDSLVAQQLLTHILNGEPGIQVIGTAATGAEAIKFVNKTKPDIITMDFYLPDANGLQVARQIMETKPVPIIIVSATWTADQYSEAFSLMDAGAVGTMKRPPGPGHSEHESLSQELVQLVKSMSEIKVVRRSAKFKAKQFEVAQIPFMVQRIVAIGASTGGPPVLDTILSQLPADFPYPIVIVQHIAEGFLDGLVNWLQPKCKLKIHIAENNLPIEVGHVYIAADHHHLAVTPQERLQLSDAEPENGIRPSVCFLFRSVAKVYGSRAIGILLTGMGKDGAAGLHLMREQGAITIAQDQDTSAVFGMPNEAIKLGAAQFILPPEKIAQSLLLQQANNQ